MKKATSNDITSAISGKADKSTTYTRNDVNKFLQQSTEGSFKFDDYTDPNNAYSGGVFFASNKIKLFPKTNTTSLADANILMWSDMHIFKSFYYTSYDIQTGGMLQTNRTDETLSLKQLNNYF